MEPHTPFSTCSATGPLFVLLGHRGMPRGLQSTTPRALGHAARRGVATGLCRPVSGRGAVTSVTFSGAVKESLAYPLRAALEDARLILPDDHEIREDLHSVRKVTTAAGNIRFDVAATEARGHADRFWAAALARHAAGDNTSGGLTAEAVVSRGRRESAELLDHY